MFRAVIMDGLHPPNRRAEAGCRGCEPRDDAFVLSRPGPAAHRLPPASLGWAFVQSTSAMAWPCPARETPNPPLLRCCMTMNHDDHGYERQGPVRLHLGAVQVGPEQQRRQLDGVIAKRFLIIWKWVFLFKHAPNHQFVAYGRRRLSPITA